jgi:hypothetical protein
VNAPKRRPTTRIAGAVLTVTALVAACTQVAPPSPSPSATASPSASPSASIAVVSPSPAVTSSATFIASASPSASPVPSTCPVAEQSGNLPSDRLVDMKVATAATADTVIFVFGNTSLPGPGGQPVGDLMVAQKPYTEGASGRPIKMAGDQVIQVRFMHLSLQSDTGDLVYQGPDSVKPRPALPALQQVELFDAFEGQMGYYIGFDGPGCVTLERVGRTVVLTFAH